MDLSASIIIDSIPYDKSLPIYIERELYGKRAGRREVHTHPTDSVSLQNPNTPLKGFNLPHHSQPQAHEEDWKGKRGWLGPRPAVRRYSEVRAKKTQEAS